MTHGHWTPRNFTRGPCTPKGNNPLNKVAELINLDTGSWNREVLETKKLKEGVKAILAIPIGTEYDDEPAWHADPKVLFQ